MITQRYNLNLIPNKDIVFVNVSQYDKLSRTIQVVLYNGSAQFEIPSGSTVTVRGTKEDNTGFEYPCTFAGNVVSFDVQEQMTIFAGKVPCEIRITSSGQIIGSCNFILNVEKTPLDSSVSISETYLPLLEEAEQNAIRAENAADEAEGVLASAVKSVNNVLPDANGNVDVEGGGYTAGTGINIANDVISADTSVLATQSDLSGKQDTLVSGTNIKTVNNTSLLGSGNVAVQPTLVSGTNIKTINSTSLLGSGNIALQPVLTAGNGIVISGNTIINRFTNLTNVDLNTIRYNCQAYVGDSCTNKPTTNGGMFICTMGSNDGTYGAQLFITYANNQGVYYRRFNGSATPTAWVKLENEITNTTGTVTASTTNFTSSTFVLTKSGKVCTLFFTGTIKVTTHGWITIGTIPTGYRPSEIVNFDVYTRTTTNNYEVMSLLDAVINTNGTIQIYAWSGNNGQIVRKQFTYICS